MNSKIHYILKTEFSNIKQKLQEDSSLFIAEIHGNDIRQLQDYLTIMSRVFQFPFPSRSLDSYNDWMRDLDWLKKDGYVLFIRDYENFLVDNTQTKNSIIDSFEGTIIPWWQEEVAKFAVDGKTKQFNVYLVE